MKKQPDKLIPAPSQAKYPTLIDLRREGGRLLGGVAAAVLATGLAGCGKANETAQTAQSAGVVDASYFQREVGIPDRPTMIMDGLPTIDVELRSDAADGVGSQPDDAQMASGAIDALQLDALPADTADTKKPDASPPDQGMASDGLPVQPHYLDSGAQDTHDAGSADQQTDQGTAVDGSTDSELDVK